MKESNQTKLGYKESGMLNSKIGEGNKEKRLKKKGEDRREEKRSEVKWMKNMFVFFF